MHYIYFSKDLYKSNAAKTYLIHIEKCNTAFKNE